jgi:hypothetical protein
LSFKKAKAPVGRKRQADCYDTTPDDSISDQAARGRDGRRVHPDRPRRVTSWWLGITFGNAAYFAVITFTTVGLGDFAPPFLHHDTTYADVVGQYLLFAASSLLGLVLLALLLKALDELLQKRLSKGIDRVAAGVLAMRRRYSSDGSRGRRRGRRASGGSRDDSRASSSTSA